MRIGISDGRIWGERHYEMLRSFGFDCYDFNMADTNSLPYTCSRGELEKYLKNEKKLADEAGITIWQIHGPWRCPPMDSTEEDLAERLEKMKISLGAAAILGAKYWVVHPIMPYGLYDVKEGNAQRSREKNLEFMSKLLRAAKQEGVTVCLENMPFLDFSISSPESIADIIREIGDKSFAMCLDTGHANVCADWDSPAQTIYKYGKYIKVLHVHDNKGRRDDHLAPLFGTVDWQAFSQALRDTSFDGVLSLECAPSPKLPKEICEQMYSSYFKIAKAVSELYAQK